MSRILCACVALVCVAGTADGMSPLDALEAVNAKMGIDGPCYLGEGTSQPTVGAPYVAIVQGMGMSSPASMVMTAEIVGGGPGDPICCPDVQIRINFSNGPSNSPYPYSYSVHLIGSRSCGNSNDDSSFVWIEGTNPSNPGGVGTIGSNGGSVIFTMGDDGLDCDCTTTFGVALTLLRSDGTPTGGFIPLQFTGSSSGPSIVIVCGKTECEGY